MSGGTSEQCQINGQYFSSYVDTEVHKLMLEDKVRTDAYRTALESNSKLIKDKVVLDIGAGSGILSLFCWKAGAKKVYAVEASDMEDTLKEIIKQNDASDCVTVIKGMAEKVDLPEKVDVIVSEWMGFYLLHESMLDSVVLARDKHLKDDGIMFPSHAKIWAAPSDHDHCHAGFWSNVYGFDMSPMAKLAHHKACQTPSIVSVKEESILSEPELLADFDLKWITKEELESMSKRCFVSVRRDAVVTGIAIWFDCTFPFTTEETKVSLDTAPFTTADQLTHWKQTLVTLPAPLSVEADDIFGWLLVLGQSKQNPRFYTISLEILDPATDEHPVPCNCQMAKCALFKALMEKEDLEEGL